MSEPPDKKTDPAPTDRADKPPSVRSVAVGAAGVATAAAATAGFVIAGPLGLAIAGLVVASGAVGVHRVANPRSRKTRPGILHALIGRPRRTGMPRGLGGKMTRSVTQARRTATSGGVGGGRKGGRGRFGLPQLPALTAKGRAKRAAAAKSAPAKTATATPRAGAAKKAAAPRAASIRPGGKPSGTRAPGTPSRTPARAGAARKLATAPGRSRTPNASGSPTLGGRRTGTGAAGRRTAGLRRTGGTGGTGRVGGGLKTGRPSTRATGTGRTRPVPRLTGSGTGSRSRRVTGPKMTTPRLAAVRRHKPTSGSTTPNRVTRGPKAATTNAKRLGNMRTPVRRVDHRRAVKATPNRTKARPIPYKTAPVGKLVHTVLRLPRIDNRRITRPTEAEQRRARRTLVLRSKVAGRRAAVKAARSPLTAGSWSWLHRPLWLYPPIPSPPDPSWQHPNVKERPPKPEPATRTRRHRTAYPEKTARRAAPQPITAASPTRGPVTMSTAAEAAGDVAAMIANHKSDSVTEFLRFLDSNAAMLRSFGQAYRTLGQRAVSEMPFAAPVGDSIASVGAGFVALEQMAAQWAPTLRAAHPEQMKNIESRRPGAEMFDVGRN